MSATIVDQEDTVNPVDEDLTYSESGLMIPRSLLDLVDQYAGLKESDTEFPFELFFKEKQVTTLEIKSALSPSIKEMESRGLTPFSVAHQEKHNLSERGSFMEMDEVGASMVLFKDKETKDEILTDLGDQYTFLPDHKLRVPSPIKPSNLAERRASRVHFQWPDESGVRQAHEEKVTGKNVVVGVLDTGIDADHVEFANRQVRFRYVSLYPQSPYWPPRDVRGFDTGGHGTHVCGIVGGTGVGVAPDVDLCVASVIESETTRTSLTRVIYGLDWILHQFSAGPWADLPKVLNMSLGFSSLVPQGIDAGTYNSILRYLYFVLGRMISSNVLPVAAIGNSGLNTYGYPGAFSNVLGIGAADFQRNQAQFSGGGQVSNPPAGSSTIKPDLMGYGVDVYSSIERITTDFPSTSL